MGKLDTYPIPVDMYPDQSKQKASNCQGLSGAPPGGHQVPRGPHGTGLARFDPLEPWGPRCVIAENILEMMVSVEVPFSRRFWRRARGAGRPIP